MAFLARHFEILLVGVPLILFLGMLAMLEAGRRAGLRRLAIDPGGKQERLGSVEGAIFSLLGLLIAFTFSGAAARYDDRRALIIEEANQLGDVVANIETLPPTTQPPIRAALRRYVQSRLDTYHKIPDYDASMAEVRHSVEIQDETWQLAVAACATPEGQRVTMLVLPSFNNAFDMLLSRTAASGNHPPAVIFGMFFVLAFAGSLVAGYGMTGGRKRNWTYMLGFAGVIAVAVYVILDIEFPRVGLVRVDAVDQLLRDVLASIP